MKSRAHYKEMKKIFDFTWSRIVGVIVCPEKHTQYNAFLRYVDGSEPSGNQASAGSHLQIQSMMEEIILVPIHQ